MSCTPWGSSVTLSITVFWWQCQGTDMVVVNLSGSYMGFLHRVRVS